MASTEWPRRLNVLALTTRAGRRLVASFPLEFHSASVDSTAAWKARSIGSSRGSVTTPLLAAAFTPEFSLC
jgi:hypothetical protein